MLLKSLLQGVALMSKTSVRKSDTKYNTLRGSLETYDMLTHILLLNNWKRSDNGLEVYLIDRGDNDE